MYRHADETQRFGNQLAFQYPVAHCHHGACRCANVLGQWQHQLRGNARVPDGPAQGLVFVLRWMDAAVEVENFSHAARSCD